MTMYLSTSNYLSGLPRWLSGKESACSAGDMGSIPGSGKSPGEGNNNPLQYLCLGNSKDRGALVGYRPWGCKRVGCDLETRQQQQESIYLPTYVISHQFSSVQLLSHVWLFATPWTVACQAPLSMEFPGKNAGVGCQFLLQEIFLTQGLNPCLLHCRQILYCWAIREANSTLW